MQLSRFQPDHIDGYLALITTLDDADVAFIHERPDDPDTVRAWASGDHRGAGLHAGVPRLHRGRAISPASVAVESAL